MLEIYARTFRIATMTDAREVPTGGSPAERRRDGRGWMRSAWRRIAGGRASDPGPARTGIAEPSRP